MNKEKKISKSKNWLFRMDPKKRAICLGCGIFLLVLVAVIGFGRSFSLPDEDMFKDQVVDGLSFENANLVYENGVSRYTVEVHNDSKSDYPLKYIEISFQNEDGVEVNKLYGYVGEMISKGEVKYLDASIDREMIGSSSIHYSIQK